jgi:hypothetical protein
MSNFIPEGVLRRIRAQQELMVLCRTVIADGHVSDEEARRILGWIEDHPDMNGVPPLDELLPLVRAIFDDSVVSDRERTDLLRLLERLTGEHEAHPEQVRPRHDH